MTQYKRNPQNICMEIDYEFNSHFRRVPWEEVFESEDALISALEDIDVPDSKTPPYNTFKGYEYIYSFANRVQRGIPLSEAQLKQAKRLALEIYKAVQIQM